MDLTPNQIQYDNSYYYFGFQELTFSTNPNTADGIFGPAIQQLQITNPVVNVGDQLNLVIPGNIADQSLYNYSVTCKYSIRAIVTGTGALSTYVGPFAVPVKVESFGNITGSSPLLFINGATILAPSFLMSGDTIKTNEKINMLTINRAIEAKISQSMDVVIANAYFTPDITAGDWELEAVVKFEIVATKKQ